MKKQLGCNSTLISQKMSSGQTLGVKAQRFRGHTSPHRNVKDTLEFVILSYLILSVSFTVISRMMSKVLFFAAVLATVSAQDSVFVRVVGSASSQNVVNVGDAVAQAIATIEDACAKGSNVDIVANSQARIVVDAAASAVVTGGIFIQSQGQAAGAGQVSASAKSSATAIARAIADAISSIAGGPSVAASTSAIFAASESVAVALNQAAQASGNARVIAASAASATAFVSAVAEALASAAASCDPATGEGTAQAQTATVAQEAPSFRDFTSSISFADVDSTGNGLARVSENSALATILGSSGVPDLAGSGPTAPPAEDLLSGIFCRLGLAPCP
eukprot:TRINITY_DN12636_c0_g1_i1.p1 TRINITY_DN12636_c0_g1~~TRINITY_DN12636_c0_g1_i1.p1  ORF type:complete len:333 (-),score=89.81 TRINITY_DN12636_c0_g1_i1:889-1887(-)